MIRSSCCTTLWSAAAVLVSCCIISTHCQIVFTNPPRDVIVVEGAAARFDCGFAASVPVSINWLRDGTILTQSTKYTFLLNNSLVIDPTETGDDVTYSCAITNQLTGQIVQQGAALQFAMFLETFVTTPTSQTVDEGETASFFCVHAGSLPPATVTWQLDGQSLVPSSRIFIVSSTLSHVDPPQVSSTLFVSPVQPADEGSYTCTATNELIAGATAVTQAASLSITPTPSPPVIIQQPENAIVPFLGQTATLSCSASGEPPPTYTWALGGIPVTLSSSVTVGSTTNGSVLTVTNVQREHLGSYSCTAVNSEGTATSDSATLEVATISADFELQPANAVAATGSSIVLECIAPLSTPPATVSWLKAFNPITDPRYQILSNGSLFVSDIVMSDQALFHCTATNPVSGVTRTSMPAQLTVLGVPVVTPSAVTVEGGGTAVFTCSAEGNPPPQITWYRGPNQITGATSPRVTITGNTLSISDISLNDEDYYTCRAVFANGETESQAILDVLSHPVFLDSSISLTGITGSPITLPCDIFPDPTASFSWSFSGETVDLSDASRYSLLDNGSLAILDVSESNEGTFTCVVTNNLGTAQGTVTLEVQSVPVVTVATPLLNVTVGFTATLNCTASGDPSPTISWSYNDQQLTSGTRYQISPDGGSLTILNAQQTDEGDYVCEAVNRPGRDSATAALNVQAVPTAQAAPPSQELLTGTTAIFSCSVSGDPAPTVRWLNARSIDVLAAGDPRIEVLNGSNTLVISDLQLSDRQQYLCEASNAVGLDIALVSLTVLAAPSVSLPSEVTSVQGESLTLDCNVIGWPVPTITWSRDGSVLEPDARIQITSEGRLVFSSLLSTDSATYSCEAANDIGTASASTAVFVQVPPIILSNIGTITSDEGDTVALDCVSVGIPQPVVTWFRDSVQLPNEGLSHIQQDQNNSLVFNGVLKSDEADYVCWAKNAAGNESATVSLRVNVPPTISAVDSFVTAIVGSRVSLTCTATGDPFPGLTWTRNGVDIPGTGMSGQYTLESNGAVLVVENVRVEDEGEFQCHASNVAGMATDNVNLNVIVPPTFSPPLSNSSAVEGSTISLTCLAIGDPTPLTVWSRGPDILSAQGTLMFAAVSRGDAGFYRCTASNSAGTISQDVYLDVYYEPVILQLNESTAVPLNGNVQLSCVADGNPTPEITWLLDGTVIPGATRTTYTISPVTGESGGEYTCTASNVVRTVSASLTLTVLFPPSSPTILTVTAISSSTISVGWSAAQSDGGSPITGYTVEYRTQGSTDSFTAVSFDESARSAILTELSPFLEYSVNVRAENVIGRSEPSGTLTARTHPASPTAPRNVRITSSTSSTIGLTWDIPSPLNGNLAAYELRYGGETDAEIDLQERLLFTNQFSIVGLSADVVYRVEVRAGTISLTGEILWGPFAVIRVQNGVIIEVVTEPPTSPPTTPPPMTTPTTQPPTTSEPTQATSAPTTSQPTTSAEETTSPTTGPTTNPTTSPTTSTPVTTSSPTTSPLNPPVVSPSLVTVLVPPGTEGQLLVYWREPTSGLDTFTGYQIFLSPPPPPTVTTPIIVERTPISGTHIISDLEHATMYTITVVTYNEDGIGPQTASASATTPESTPSAPRQVSVSPLSQQAVFVTWSPPEPSNGIILDYTVRLLSEPSGQLVNVATVELTITNFGSLDLENSHYSITVTARTSAGMGPESDPVFFGTETFTPTPPRTEPTSESPISSSPTPSPAATTTLLILTPITASTSTPLTTSLPSETPPPPGTTTPTSSPPDDTYYIVRIVPPVVFGVFLIVMALVTVLLCVHTRGIARKKRAGAYHFDGTDSQDLKLLTLKAEQEVVPDDGDSSTYQVKDALDANFSYSSLPKKEGYEKNNNEDIDEPDIGVELDTEEGVHTLSSPVGRDALEESPSRPVSEEVSTRVPGNQNRAPPLHDVPPKAVTFDPNVGLSGGGLMETRIGAVGSSRDFNQRQRDGLQAGAAAQMY